MGLSLWIPILVLIVVCTPDKTKLNASINHHGELFSFLPEHRDIPLLADDVNNVTMEIFAAFDAHKAANLSDGTTATISVSAFQNLSLAFSENVTISLDRSKQPTINVGLVFTPNHSNKN